MPVVEEGDEEDEDDDAPWELFEAFSEAFDGPTAAEYLQNEKQQTAEDSPVDVNHRLEDHSRPGREPRRKRTVEEALKEVVGALYAEEAHRLPAHVSR